MVIQPLNAANVRPETVIARPDQYVGITTWKGDDQASHVINDLNFNGVPQTLFGLREEMVVPRRINYTIPFVGKLK